MGTTPHLREVSNTLTLSGELAAQTTNMFCLTTSWERKYIESLLSLLSSEIWAGSNPRVYMVVLVLQLRGFGTGTQCVITGLGNRIHVSTLTLGISDQIVTCKYSTS